MRQNIFKKANYLKDKTKIELETDNSITFKVNKQEVRIYYKNHQLIHACTCMLCSLRPDAICSHKLSAFNCLTNGSKTHRKTKRNP